MQLARFLLPFRWQVPAAVALGAAVVASNIGLLGAAGYLIAAAAARHSLLLLLAPIYLVRLLSITRGLARYGERLVSHDVTFRILARLRVWLYDGLTRPGATPLTVAHSGDTLGRLLGDVEEMQNAYLRLVSPLAVAGVIAALLIYILHGFSDAIAGLAAIFLLAAGLGIPLSAWMLSRGLGRSFLAARAGLNAALVDTIQGAPDILSHGYGETQLRRLAALERIAATTEQRIGLTSAAREALTDLLGNLAVLATLALTIPLLAGRPAGALYLAVPSLLVLAGFEAVRPLGPAAQTFERVQAAGSRLLVIGDRRLELPEPVTALAPPTVGCLSFDRVTFTYPDARRPALQDVTFIIPAGGRIAVVGPSGAGKTTLVQLLLRFRDPSGGAITLDGADIRGYRPADLRAVMAVVGQDTYLFDDTVRANLLLACPDVTEAELVDALAAARLGELVQALPRGLNTPIGEHGARLSGGERQRLAIARAFLQDAPLLILDEPTANLDPLTEWDVLDSLHQLMRGRTTLLITHRLVRMEEMDEIAVLNQGCIVECGSHADLCARRGLYRSMLDVQSDTIPSYPL